jgi:hypothetical protein
MTVSRHRCLLLPLCLCLLAACTAPPTPEQQLDQYIAFYYPATTDGIYDIVFDWGVLQITCELPVTAEAHEDSGPYLGFVTLRPKAKAGMSLPDGIRTTLIEADGSVWQLPDTSDVAESSTREEVVVEKEGGVTSTTTTTIESVSEPVIDHFRTQPEAWLRYGTLTASGGESRLEKTAL